MPCADASKARKLPCCSSRGWWPKERAYFCYTLSSLPIHIVISKLITGRKFMLVLARRSALALLAFALCATCACAQGWQHLGGAQRVEKLKDGVELTVGSAKVRINSFNDSVIRVRVATQGNFA